MERRLGEESPAVKKPEFPSSLFDDFSEGETKEDADVEAAVPKTFMSDQSTGNSSNARRCRLRVGIDDEG